MPALAHLRSPLAVRLVFCILLFSTLAALVSTAVQLYFEYWRDMDHITTTVDQVRDSHLSAIESSLWVYDLPLLQVQLEGIKRLPDVQAVTLYKNGENLLAIGSASQDNRTFASRFPLKYTHRGQAQQLGTLVVVFSLKGVYQRLWDRVMVILVTQTLKTFCVSIFIVFLFYALVGRHLVTMAEFARSLRLDSLATPLVLQRKPDMAQQSDELGLVESAINTMRQNLLLEIETVRSAQEALAHSEQRFRTLVANIPGIVFRCELQPPWNVIYISEAVAEVTGYPAEIFLRGDRGLGHSVHPEDLDWVTGQMEVHVASRTPYAIEYRILHQDGTVHWVFEKGAPIAGPGQQPLWLDGVILDITELKQAQQHNEELERKFLQSQKMESVGRLAGGVAHDFNNMLGVIIGHTEIAQEKLPADNPVQTELANIRAAAERSAALTQQLLAFARKQTYAPKVIDLNATVAGMLPMLSRLIGEDIDLAWRPGSDGQLIKMDPTQIEQILANLCVNARDAITDTGKITIETGTAVFDQAYCTEHPDFVPGSYVLLAVSDNGSGMDSETLAHLFEPFFTTKELGKGTGLGLATVYGIVKQNSGFINVYSEVGQGTTFRIYLARYQGEAVAVGSGALAVERAQGRERILLVEDEPMLIEMTTSMLERQGYTVLSAATPSEAMRLAGEQGGAIDLLITDVVMPEMNGRELAARLADIVPQLKCLFVSGYTANVIAHHGVLDEGVHFMQKPFSSRELAAKVRGVLETGGTGSQSA